MSANETSSENSVAAAIVIPNSLKSRPMLPDMKLTGRNTITSTRVIEMAARPISLRPISAAARGSVALFQVARDVLDDHDRVVDEDADRQGQG